MIFYLTQNDEGYTRIVGTQVEAKKHGPTYSQIDIPTDKTGLMAWIQQMFDETINVETAPATSTSADNLQSAAAILEIADEIINDDPIITKPNSAFPLIEAEKHHHPRMRNILERISVEEVIDCCNLTDLVGLESVIESRRNLIHRQMMIKQEPEV